MKTTNPMEAMMKNTLEALKCAALLAAAVIVAAVPSPATAAETAEEYIAEARPYLHLSCEGAWESVNEDGKAYVEVVNKLSAIHFINYDFKIETLEALPKEELEALRVKYYNEIGSICRETPQRLLAGVIERALVDTFASLQQAGK